MDFSSGNQHPWIFASQDWRNNHISYIQSTVLHILYYPKAFSRSFDLGYLPKRIFRHPEGHNLLGFLDVMRCQNGDCKAAATKVSLAKGREYQTSMSWGSGEPFWIVKVQLLLKPKFPSTHITFVLKIFPLPDTEDKILASLISV